MQPDPEILAVAWARQVPTLEPLIGAGTDAKVATRLPGIRRVNGRDVEGWTGSFLRVFAIGVGEGALVAEDGDVAGVLLQWDAYAKTDRRSPDYGSASLLARTAAAAMHATQDAAFAGEGMVIGFGSITVPRRTEEPETQWARYTFESSIVVRAIA